MKSFKSVLILPIALVGGIGVAIALRGRLGESEQSNLGSKGSAGTENKNDSTPKDESSPSVEPRKESGGNSENSGGPTGTGPKPPLPGSKIIEETLFAIIWKTPDGGRIKDYKFPRTDAERGQVAAALTGEMDLDRARDGIKSALGGLEIRINRENVWDPALDQAIRHLISSHPIPEIRVQAVIEILNGDKKFDDLLDYTIDRLGSSPSTALRSKFAAALAAGQKKAKPTSFLKGEELENWKVARAGKVRKVLVAMRDSDQDPEVRIAAERAIVELDGP